MPENLDQLRARAGIGLLVFLWGQLPVIFAVAALRGDDWLLPVLIGVALAGAASLVWTMNRQGLAGRLMIGIALVGLISVIVYQLAGHPWQIDLHMAYFSVLAMLCVFCDWRVILVSALAIALHHLGMNAVYPAAVFPDGADFNRVIVHAVVVAGEAAALIWLTASLPAILESWVNRQRDDDMRVAAERAAFLRQQQDARDRTEHERRELLSGLAAQFQTSVQSLVTAIVDDVSAVEGRAQHVAETAEQTNHRAMTVASAAEQASANVETVASATEQLSASVSEIGRQVSESTRIAAVAVEEAGRTNQTVGSLSDAAQKIGEIVDLINSIAAQTNLLALNATIEAARAGDAGRGFAVVASEVKNLAHQTGKATEDIQAQVGAMQEVTALAVGAIRSIGGTIERMSEITTTIAAAVEQQGAAIEEIARNLQQAAEGTQTVTGSIGEVSRSASETGQMVGDTLEFIRGLKDQAGRLTQEVEDFLAQIESA